MKTPDDAIMATETNSESMKQSEELALRLRERILVLARTAGHKGLTINEAERQIEDHKGHSISPRFSELVREGSLVRVLVGHGKATKRFPRGVRRYVTRFDDDTRRNVTVHWTREFAPLPSKKSPRSSQDDLETGVPLREVEAMDL